MGLISNEETVQMHEVYEIIRQTKKDTLLGIKDKLIKAISECVEKELKG